MTGVTPILSPILLPILASSLVSAPAAQSLQHACGQLTDVAAPSVTYAPSEGATPLERRHDLFEIFSRGDGELTRTGAELHERAALYPLPWESAAARREHVRLVAWQDRERVNDENMLAIVLRDGESWCSPELEWDEGARVRFEALSIERDRTAVLELTGERLPAPGALGSERQSDVALEGTSGRVCFRVRGGAAAIGEPRIVEPDKGQDARPRWVVLTIVDSLRGDLVRDDRDGSIMPALHRLGEEGHFYERAVSPGCHTRASVWPIMMGRDLMRVDPIRRRQSMPVESPLRTVYSRANVFVSHLAQSAGYHAVFLGNNAYLRVTPAFSRYSRWGNPDRGITDVIEALPDLMARYADERVMLVYYISAPHGHYRTPTRLFDELGCRELVGLEQCRCAYRARAVHADEAIAALREGLKAHGLSDDTVHVVTADHGELFEDGLEIEGEMPTFATGARQGTFQSFNRGHGNSCHAVETDVPLVVHGKGLKEGRWSEAVSGLDIMPTLLTLMRIEPVNRLDGETLPLARTVPLPSSRGLRPLVSYGFCSDSVFEGDTQLLWWVQGCRLRHIGDKTPVASEAELWSRGQRRALDESPVSAMRRHEAWVEERLGADSLVFATTNLDAATVVIEVSDGIISDFGPASTVYGLERIRSTSLSDDGRRLRVELDGYRGLFHVSTFPANAPMRAQIEGAPGVVRFVGPLQLPLPTDTIDPSERPRFFFADTVPERRDTDVPALQMWWQRFGAESVDDGH